MSSRRHLTPAEVPAGRGLSLRRPAPRDIESATGGSSRALKVVASVAANLTLFTALLYYFGFLYTQVFFAYFRVHYTLLGQTVDEILARGVDGMLLPIAGAGGTGLALLGTVRVLRSLLPQRIWAVLPRIGTPVAAIVGLALVGIAVPIAINPEPFRTYAGLPGLGLAIGVILLVLAWRRLPSGRHGSTFMVVEWITIYLLVAFGLFWAVGDYSSGVGARKAFDTASAISTRPAVTLYSARSLNLEADGVHQVVCAQPDATYKYRYSGLRLLLQSGGQYVFLPATWRPSRGASFVIPRTDSLRLEFAPAMTIPSKTC